MKGFIVLLLCLFCLTGCGYSLQGTWKVNPLVEVEFRSDGSILELGQKAEGLTWHGDYICLKADIKKIRDARINELTRQKKHWVDYSINNSDLAHIAREELKPIDQQLEDLKNGKVMEWSDYDFPMAKGVDKKDISESADKVEVRIHWVDADHFDLGSTSFSRVKETK